jgi:predicted NAD-dependent protein-ADP-ribosyltransferase YbiA (DUF1768 family)
MKAILKEEVLVLLTESEDDTAQMSNWVAAHADHIFVLMTKDSVNFWLKDLGARSDACHEPINVVSTSPDEGVKLISNLAHMPFKFDSRSYASVEGFWQGLKFYSQKERERIAQLYGLEAKRAGESAPDQDSFQYEGRTIHKGCYEHWALMHRACWAKFTQREAAREALLSTGSRPLVHRVKRDSRTIPGVIMADIWMRIRAHLAQPAV